MIPAHQHIQGPSGLLELIANKPLAGTSSRQGVAVICHPHPLHGGTMQNKVVTTLERTFLELGLAAVRFNFRGVGASSGQYDEGVGEGEDLAAVVTWAREQWPGYAIWLAGFSFGAFVSARMAATLGATQLISIAPPVGKWDFATMQAPPCPWTVVMGEQDEVIDPAIVLEFFDQKMPQATVLRFATATHFFHGLLTLLREELIAALKPMASVLAESNDAT
jgi:uncharacterized protein